MKERKHEAAQGWKQLRLVSGRDLDLCGETHAFTQHSQGESVWRDRASGCVQRDENKRMKVINPFIRFPLGWVHEE